MVKRITIDPTQFNFSTILVIILVIGFTQTTIGITKSEQIGTDPIPSTYSLSHLSANPNDFKPHEPIRVNSDSELEAMAISGTGIETDPYILEGWNIITLEEHAISINGTTKHFIIRNTWVEVRYREDPFETKVYYGISVANAANGTVKIVNNTCVTNSHGFGIYVFKSESSFVTNNTIKKNHYGIFISESSYSKIVNNICNDNGLGIVISISDYCTITSNICNKNHIYGIYMGSSSHSIAFNNTVNQNSLEGFYLYYCGFCTIANNIINQTHVDGIFLHHSIFIAVTNNTISYSGDDGIRFLGSSETVIRWNTFKENQGYGIRMVGLEIYNELSKNNLVHHNNFFNNGGEHHVIDTGFNNRWGWNYWDDYNGTGSYLIEGTAKTFDPYPLLQPAVSGTKIPSGYDITTPSIDNLTRQPLSPTSMEKIVINVKIYDESGIESVLLYYSVNNSELQMLEEFNLTMNLTNNNVYQVLIGPFPNGTEISFRILTTDGSEFQNKIITKWERIIIVDLVTPIENDTTNTSSTTSSLQTSSLTFTTFLPSIIVILAMRNVRKKAGRKTEL